MLLTDAHKLDDRDSEVVVVIAIHPALFRDVDYSEDEECQHGEEREAEVDLHKALELRPLLYLGRGKYDNVLNRM